MCLIVKCETSKGVYKVNVQREKREREIIKVI